MTPLQLLQDYPLVSARDATRIEEAVRAYASAVGFALGDFMTFHQSLAFLTALAGGPQTVRHFGHSPTQFAHRLAQGGVN